MKKETKELDFQLIKATLSGDKVALSRLIEIHYNFTFNICLKMLFNQEDAEDANQEIWVKTITSLKNFNYNSAFTTWLYRITVNHILDMKKNSIENEIKGFQSYGEILNLISDTELNSAEMVDMKEVVEEAKIGCMSGMLMCLDREQRLLYVLGCIFKIDHHVGSQIFGISKDNYRQKLSRAKKDIHSFMDNQCSLVNKNNRCVCSKKTKGFIKMGFVDPENLQFNSNFKDKILDNLVEKSNMLDDFVDDYHVQLFQEHPFKEKPITVLENVLKDSKLRSILNLD